MGSTLGASLLWKRHGKRKCKFRECNLHNFYVESNVTTAILKGNFALGKSVEHKKLLARAGQKPLDGSCNRTYCIYFIYARKHYGGAEIHPY